ncbi:MAG: phosphatase PAP2 family protein [Specibacter sp.]
MSTHAARSHHGNHLPERAAIAAAPFVVSALVCLAGLMATYVFFIRTTSGQFMDESALVQAAVAQRFIGTQTSQWLDFLPVTSVVLASVVVLFVTLARRRWKSAGIALAAMGAANLSTQLIKLALPDRPSVGIATLAFNSLPSGHSTLAASAAAAVFLVVSPRWRPAAGFVGGSYAIMAGVSTLINQWHRPADVMAAFFVVAFWALLAALLILRTGPRWNVWLGPDSHWASRRWWTWLAGLIAVLAGLAAVLILRVEVGRDQTSTTGYFFAGVGQIMAVGYGLTALGTLFLTRQVRRRS